MWGSRFLVASVRSAWIGITFLLSTSSWADTSYKYELAGQFRAIGPNAGGVPVIGASFKYRWFEASAAYNGALGFIAGAAYRVDLNEDSFFVPHITIGLPMFGPGFNIRVVKLFGAHFGFRFDSYAFLYVPSFQIEPLLTLGASVAF